MKNSKTVSFKEGEPEIFTYDQDKSILESEREKAFRESLKNAAPVVVEYKPCKRSGLSEIFRPEENALVEEGKLSDGDESDKDEESGIWSEISEEEAAARFKSQSTTIGVSVAGSKDFSKLSDDRSKSEKKGSWLG